MRGPLLLQRILWLALTAATVLVGVAAFVMPPAEAHSFPDALPVAFAAASTLLVAGSFLLPQAAFAAAVRRHATLVTEEHPPSYREGPGRARVVRVDADTFRALSRAWVGPLMISMALSESVEVLGLLLSRFGFAPRMFGAFVAAGAMLTLIRFPTKVELLSRTGRVMRAAVVDLGSG